MPYCQNAPPTYEKPSKRYIDILILGYIRLEGRLLAFRDEEEN